MDTTAPNNLPTPEPTTNSRNDAVLEHPTPQNDAVQQEINESEEIHQNPNPQNDDVTHETNQNEETQQIPNPQNDDAMEVDEEGDEQTLTRNGVGESAEDMDTGASAAVESVGIDTGNGNAVVASNGGKNKKKKNNCLWIMRSARKSKKRAKFSGNSGGVELDEEKVLITPVVRPNPEKVDDTVDMKICLSKTFKAEKVELSDDRLTAGSCKGYRMVRATRGVVEGAWYFEIKVLHLGETGHTRLGWSNEKGDLQAPVGYDDNSFGYRDIDGSKIHKALRESYGDEGYKEGDVIGCYISLPDGGLYAPKPQTMVLYKGQRYFRAATGSVDQKEDVVKIVPGSVISFFKNGTCQGVAYKDLSGGRYYPAASMYTLPNQPHCVVRFNFGPEFDFFPEDFGEYPIPRPMIEVPYQGHDFVVENGVSDESKQQ